MVFQGALNALNPLHRIGDQIAEPIILHKGISENQAIEKVKHLMEQVGISSEKINSYPFELSGGMKQRVMISMALACDPKIVIADEPTTALDVITAWRILDLIKNLQRQLNLSMILITHDLSVIAQLCDDVAIMYAGEIVEQGNVESIFETAIHPYTQMLINSFTNIKNIKTRIEPIGGESPNLINPPSGCRFHPRCPNAMDICRKEKPDPIEVAKDHLVSCHITKRTLK